MNRKDLLFGLVFYYFPALLWMFLIFYLSSIPGLKTGVEPVELEIFFRKTAHLFEYFVLTFLFWRIFRERWKMSFRKAGVFCFLLVLVYAVSDELHQNFVEDRAGRALDVLIDVSGALLALITLKFLSKIKKQQ